MSVCLSVTLCIMAVSAGVGTVLNSVKSCASVLLVGMHFRFLGIPYYFVGVAIYRAHRAVTFAIAWLSCLNCCYAVRCE